MSPKPFFPAVSRRFLLTTTATLAAVFGPALPISKQAQAQTDPLPSWNDGKAKQSIIAFVEKATKPGSPGFVPVSERIATFDNDGTLWCEKCSSTS